MELWKEFTKTKPASLNEIELFTNFIKNTENVVLTHLFKGLFATKKQYKSIFKSEVSLAMKELFFDHVFNVPTSYLRKNKLTNSYKENFKKYINYLDKNINDNELKILFELYFHEFFKKDMVDSGVEKPKLSPKKIRSLVYDPYWGISNPKTMLGILNGLSACLLYTSPSPRDRQKSRMPSSA